MIISHKHKYIFVELPRTGTTAIASELKLHYDGQEIYRKHTTYSYFLKHCTEEEKNYTAFSCRRDPVDRVFSYYQKMKSGVYDEKFGQTNISLYDKIYLLPTVKWIQTNQVDFELFLKKKYKLPYCDWSILDHHRMKYVIDFENLNAEFKHVLNSIGLQVVRDLPKKNATSKSSAFQVATQNVSKETLVDVFAPYVIEQDYKNSIIYSYARSVGMNKNIIYKYKVSKMMYKTYYFFAGARNK